MTENTAAANPTISIEKEMKQSYLDYAMSVIVSRAIPDVRDGLKPVHRRILFGMLELGVDYNKPYKKSARIVGDVMGKYHPHGDSAIYDSLVRMAQPFAMSLPLVDGQGNFGSMDGDNAAAMRYTEARLAKPAHSLLNDIDADTVDWQENYDGSEKEPKVLPAAYPNLLVNGAGGIAVGMATNIPPHNLGEVCDAACKLIDAPETSIDELMAIIPGPDFPTGGTILGRSGSHSAMHTGKGSVVLRGKTEIEEIGNREAIIVTEIPYQVNKSKLVERMAECVREKRVEGISDLRDESDKSGVRIVIELKRDAVADVVLAQLFQNTQLQTSFPANMLALHQGRPQQLNLKDMLEAFIAFREEVITRRTRFKLGKARDRAHTLIGLAIAVANIDEVIAVIRAAKDPNEAREELMNRSWKADDVIALLDLVDDRRNAIEGGKIKFTEEQAKAILELRLQRLTGLEQEKINGELAELAAEIKEFLSILGDRDKLYGIMRAELVAIREEFAVPRRTEIEESEFELDMEDLIAREEMVVTITQNGYIKRSPLDTYRAQRRGGKGRKGMATREEDMVTTLFVANTHTPLLFFSSIGKVYKLKTYRLPIGEAQARGKALINMLPLEQGETIQTVLPWPSVGNGNAELENQDENPNPESQIPNPVHSLIFATKQGNIRRSELSDFENIMRNGKIAIRLDDTDELVSVRAATDQQHIMMAAKSGKCIRFTVDGLRVIKSRTSSGVRGMKLAKGDEVVFLSILDGAEIDMEERSAYLKWANAQRRSGDDAEESNDDASAGDIAENRAQELSEKEEFILSITERGYGKRTSAYEYRITNRGGSGITNIVTSERNGPVVASFPIEAGDQIMLMTNAGKMIRTPIKDVRIAGRNTQGVKLFDVAKGEVIVSTARINEAIIGVDIDEEVTEEGIIDTEVTPDQAPE